MSDLVSRNMFVDAKTVLQGLLQLLHFDKAPRKSLQSCPSITSKF